MNAKTLLLLAALAVFSLVGTTAQDEIQGYTRVGPRTAPKKVNVVWQKDPVCQFVFFAVLEGLYRDGVQNEVVDLILGVDEEELGEEEKVKHCFVFKCELCHATYEAFKAYRHRPAFANTTGVTTFGDGVDEKIVSQLKSKDPRDRIYAMGSLVRPWIQQRVQAHRLTAEEKQQMKEVFIDYAKEGRAILSHLRREPGSVYIDWNFYGTCQACEAAQDFAEDTPVLLPAAETADETGAPAPSPGR